DGTTRRPASFRLGLRHLIGLSGGLKRPAGRRAALRGRAGGADRAFARKMNLYSSYKQHSYSELLEAYRRSRVASFNQPVRPWLRSLHVGESPGTELAPNGDSEDIHGLLDGG